MKLTAKTIGSFLQKPTTNAVLIYGPDQGLVIERMKQLIARVLPDPGAPFALVELSETEVKNEPTRVTDELCAMSLMGGSRCIVLRDFPDKLAGEIEAALPHARPDAFLIVTADDLGPRAALRALFEASQHGASLPCYRDEGMDLEGAIRARLSLAGMTCSRDALGWLAQNLGNDRQVTNQEIDKLALYAAPATEITLEMAQEAIAGNRHATLDQLCHALADRNPAQLQALLPQIWREGTPPVGVLRAIMRYMERLYTLQAAVQSGQSLEEAIGGLRPPVFFKHTAGLQRHVRAWSLPQIARAQTALAKAELQCKQGVYPPELLSGQLLLRMAASGSRVAA